MFICCGRGQGKHMRLPCAVGGSLFIASHVINMDIDPDVYVLQLRLLLDKCIQSKNSNNINVIEDLTRKLSIHRELLYALLHLAITSHDNLRPLIERLFEIVQDCYEYYEEQTLKINRLNSNEYSYSCPLNYTGANHRPSYVIQQETINSLFAIHRRWTEVARELGISYRTLLRRRQQYGLPISMMNQPQVVYSDIPDDQLCLVINDILKVSYCTTFIQSDR